MRQLKKWTTVAAVSGFLLISVSSVTQAHWLYKDIDSVPWAQSSIINAHQMNVIDGMTDENYAPQSEVTWGQFMKMIVMTDHPSFTAAAGQGNNWWQPYVDEAQKAKGFVDASYSKENVNKPISRLEIARIVSRVLDPSLRFKPVDEATASSAMQKQGILEGRSDGDLALKENLTRAEAAVIVDRLFEKNGLYGKRYDQPDVKAASGMFSTHGLMLGQTAEQAQAILGQPLKTGKDDADGAPYEKYKNYVLTYMNGKIAEITYRGPSADLHQAKEELGGSAIFQDKANTFYYFGDTDQLLIASENSIIIKSDTKNMDSYIQGGELKSVNEAAKAYVSSLNNHK
ncbi:S-layer homology domain-containing protein [Paenibacillus sp. FJAT-26967]|uniref:S-layer homology domain-containing protein n=1 Tax=Paenibacillus sp. FJAT-26967 TaxID=1729690 RepID=UPI000837B56F|nr:S-layer homology domain-containing protein [Paenibacillus sp. FJAT-26967]